MCGRSTAVSGRHHGQEAISDSAVLQVFTILLAAEIEVEVPIP
jgi:hypothetical protein